MELSQTMMFGVEDVSDGSPSMSDTLAEWKEFRRVAKAESGLVPVVIAAKRLGVSRARAYQLVEAGILSRWEFFGRYVLSCREVEAHARQERSGTTRYAPV